MFCVSLQNAYFVEKDALQCVSSGVLYDLIKEDLTTIAVEMLILFVLLS